MITPGSYALPCGDDLLTTALEVLDPCGAHRSLAAYEANQLFTSLPRRTSCPSASSYTFTIALFGSSPNPIPMAFS